MRYLVGGLEPWNFMTFHWEFQSTPSDELSMIFQRGRAKNHQAVEVYCLIRLEHDRTSAGGFSSHQGEPDTAPGHDCRAGVSHWFL